MSYDTYSGIVTMPDGRKCKATLYGAYASGGWEEPPYFEERQNDPLEAEWVDDDTPLTADDYNAEYTVLGSPYYGHEWIVEQLFKNGDFEHGDMEP